MPPNCGVSGGFADLGDWKTSSISTGLDNVPSSIWTQTTGAVCVWKPKIDVPGKVRISFFRMRMKDEKNDPNLKIEIRCGGKIETRFVDCNDGVTGWTELGEFPFEGKGEEIINVVKMTPGCVSRTGPFLLELVDPAFQGEATSRIRVMPAREEIDMTVFEPKKIFGDLLDRPEGRDIITLINREITPGTEGDRFFPDRAITGRDFAALMEAVLRERGFLSPADEIVSKKEITADEAAGFLCRCLDAMKRNVPWLDRRCPKTASPTERMKAAGIFSLTLPPTLPTGPLRRIDAFVMAKRFLQTFVLAGPPVDADWELTFEENFDGNRLNLDVWASQNGPSGHILSSRWIENVSVENGLCKLTARKETRAGQDWTAGSIWVKPEVFKQAYGYWECRYRYGNATGLNNSFWMYLHGHLEIDINEGHWPNEVNTNLHWWEKVGDKTVRKTQHEAIPVPENLAEDFHTYACLWNETEIVYFFDGREIGKRKPSRGVHAPVTPILSLAVIAWAGPVTDDAHGKSMDVDWVRVYKIRQKP